MEINWDLVRLVAGWAVTIGAWLVLLVGVISLYDKDDPGGCVLYHEAHWSSKAGYVGLFYLSVIWVFGSGFRDLLWMVPEYRGEDDTPRASAALLLALGASVVLFHLIERVNRLHWHSLGKEESLSDIERLANQILYRNELGVQILDEMIENIDADHNRKWSLRNHEIARRRIEFLKKLRSQTGVPTANNLPDNSAAEQ